MKKLNTALFTVAFGVTLSATLFAAERRFHAWACFTPSFAPANLVDANHLWADQDRNAHLVCDIPTDNTFPGNSIITVDGDDYDNVNRIAWAFRRVSFRGTDGGALAPGVGSSTANGTPISSNDVRTWTGRFSMVVPQNFPGNKTGAHYPQDYHYVFVQLGTNTGLTGFRVKYP